MSKRRASPGTEVLRKGYSARTGHEDLLAELQARPTAGLVGREVLVLGYQNLLQNLGRSGCWSLESLLDAPHITYVRRLTSARMATARRTVADLPPLRLQAPIATTPVQESLAGDCFYVYGRPNEASRCRLQDDMRDFHRSLGLNIGSGVHNVTVDLARVLLGSEFGSAGITVPELRAQVEVNFTDMLAGSEYEQGIVRLYSGVDSSSYTP